MTDSSASVWLRPPADGATMLAMQFGRFVLGVVGGGIALGAFACGSDQGPEGAEPGIEVAGPKVDAAAPTVDAADATDAGALPPATCSNGARDGDESDVDCGGTCTTKCAAQKACTQATDCATGLDCIGSICLAATSNNGIKDGRETDTDCGGGAAPKCDDHKACLDGTTDCTSGVCTGNVCQPPSPTDTVKNGTETDVDCGGPDSATPRCAVSKACGGNADCFQPFCENHVCIEPPSCRALGNGTNTCGPSGNESCCTTLPVGGGSFNQLGNAAYAVTLSPYKLDKYEITQGRLRAFYAAYGGNLRANPPAAGAGANPHVANSGWQSVWNDRLPEDMTQVHARIATGDGCYGGDDAHTWTDAASANDAKAVNCVDWYTLAAFCIWDGGRLPTEAEWGFAAEGADEARKFAWGNTPDASIPIPAGQDPNTYGNMIGKWVVHGFCDSGGPSCFSYGGAVRIDGDGPAHIAPPGQKLDIGRFGHHDMSGNLIEWTLDNADGSNPCSGADCARVNWPDYHAVRKAPDSKTIVGDRSVGGLPSYWRNYNYNDDTHDMDARYQLDGGRVMRGGSWEIAHPVTVRNRYGNYPIWRAYYASGARCARD